MASNKYFVSGCVKIIVPIPSRARNVIELFKLKHQHEWKKNSKISEDEQARKKWALLPNSKKNEYIEELKKINEEYLDTFGRFLQVSRV